MKMSKEKSMIIFVGFFSKQCENSIFFDRHNNIADKYNTQKMLKRLQKIKTSKNIEAL